MATISELIPGAFYMAKAGGLSKQGGQLPSAAQEADALAILNRVLDSLSLDASFNSFLYELPINQPMTRELYIGRNLTPVTGVTIIDADPFKLIFAASLQVPQIPYSLIIQNLVDLVKVPSLLETDSGQPGYLYWGIQEQDGNIFTRIILYPTPNQTGDLKIIGTRVLPSNQTLVADVLPTFFLYLQYRLALQLCREYGNMAPWKEGGYESDLVKYENAIANNSPINARPNDITQLLSRREYDWWGGYY